jgi:hypothetical protein
MEITTYLKVYVGMTFLPFDYSFTFNGLGSLGLYVEHIKIPDPPNLYLNISLYGFRASFFDDELALDINIGLDISIVVLYNGFEKVHF